MQTAHYMRSHQTRRRNSGLTILFLFYVRVREMDKQQRDTVDDDLRDSSK